MRCRGRSSKLESLYSLEALANVGLDGSGALGLCQDVKKLLIAKKIKAGKGEEQE
jgi:hypothetical protein